jgi:hypothetical protein
MVALALMPLLEAGNCGEAACMWPSWLGSPVMRFEPTPILEEIAMSVQRMQFCAWPDFGWLVGHISFCPNCFACAVLNHTIMNVLFSATARTMRMPGLTFVAQSKKLTLHQSALSTHDFPRLLYSTVAHA